MSLSITEKGCSPRIKRLVESLLAAPQSVRDLIDVIPTNNPAEYVRQLRTMYGLTIPCHHIRFKTLDGTSSWHGEYHLTHEDRKKLEAA